VVGAGTLAATPAGRITAAAAAPPASAIDPHVSDVTV
jgi:hypothetical protein